MPRKESLARREYARGYQAQRRLAKAQQRWAERVKRVAKRKSPPALECAWAAGHFEGEGTVTLTRGGRVMHVRPLVSLSSTDKSAVDFFHERWPGNRRSFTPKSASGNVRVAHTWTIASGERIECFLLDILPYVQAARVHRKIKIVLEDIRDRGLYQQQPETRLRSHQRREAIRLLNAKGRDSVVMPDGLTVGQHTRPTISQAYKEGGMVPLLPSPTQKRIGDK